MKKLLLFCFVLVAIHSQSQNIGDYLLTNLTNETNGKIEKTNFFILNLADGTKAEVRTTAETFSSIMSRDNFVAIYPRVVEGALDDNISGVKAISKVESLKDLPVLILNLNFNKMGVNIQAIDSEGTRNKFKPWVQIFKELKLNIN